MHISVALNLLRKKELVSIRVFTKKGKILEYNDVRLHNYYHNTGEVKVRFEKSGEIRSFPMVFLIEINDEEVYL